MTRLVCGIELRSSKPDFFLKSNLVKIILKLFKTALKQGFLLIPKNSGFAFGHRSTATPAVAA